MPDQLALANLRMARKHLRATTGQVRLNGTSPRSSAAMWGKQA